MADRQDERGKSSDRRSNDRRLAQTDDYAGPERRKGERRSHERRSA